MTDGIDLSNVNPVDIEELKKSVELQKSPSNHDFENIEIFAIFDKKGEKFDVPFFSHSALFAKRKFIMMSKEDSMLKAFKNDFDLVHVGSFNIVTGTIRSLFQVVLTGNQITKEEDDENSNEPQI